MLTVLSLAPGILMTVTSFTRIVVALSLLRTGIGAQGVPPNPVIISLAMFLSFFVMAPTITQINATAIQPYAESKIGATDMIKAAAIPLHTFMTKQTRKKDITMFAGIAKSGPYKQANDIPFSV
uniref:flagellar type III secretion system pore protein FliP n=1 Tax=Pseudomonas sp. EA_5y_Pfl2_R50 TaxID=3088691 RepID=UPI0030DD7A49